MERKWFVLSHILITERGFLGTKKEHRIIRTSFVPTADLTFRQLSFLVLKDAWAALSTIFDEVVGVNEISSKDSVHLALLKRLELGATFTKLHCWTLTQYSKCVFMDADTLVLCNIDELFDREELSAAPDSGWPDCFNSGVFVFQPSLKTFNLLMKFASEHGSFDGGDQGLLNIFFGNWATTDINKHLPFIYNLSSSALYTYAPAFQHFGKDAKVVHFLGPAKPWNYAYNPQTKTVSDKGSVTVSQNQLPFLQLWWATYNSSILPLLESVQKTPGPHIQTEESKLNGDESKFERGDSIASNTALVPSNVKNVLDNAVNIPDELPAENTLPTAECNMEINTVAQSDASPETPVQPVPELRVAADELISSVSELSIQAKPEEPSAEDERRKWEEGHIDYLGKDAFENIKKKLDSFLL
uniref:glycogenin glucosyltransferase n=1 Tax=Salvator merianae TaxID=96440 RepID=A0A8D0EC52_SALMN